MFSKLLIANRGEIACRAIKTCRRLGIRTVAVYSEADRDALHARQADEALAIGPPPSTQSYLDIDRIVRACRDSGAEAVYPGYGFLSENAEFARRLEAAGVVFVGPGADAIEAMGDKITSKKLAVDAGVNTVPGYNEVIRDADQAVAVARDLGYPVMLKASAGGGGKGMRVAGNDAECRDGFERAGSEARSSFGDGRVFVEKFIEQPRHIEIQLIADGRGKVLYLNERECSVQRRHQKVLEEAPSPFLDAETRRRMGEQACALARAVDYRSAGTVEFVVDAERNFYFLEMNTRLQVEHPVTEMITGLDLIELMLRVAAGEPLALDQDDVGINGWALEARVYAENPRRNFLPSTGRLVRYRPPQENRRVRVDTGVYEGGEVSMFYDPMIAKLITWGEDRRQALVLMARALDEYHIRGVESNLSFLSALIAHPRFIAGSLDTHFIAEEYPEGFQPIRLPDEDRRRLAAVAVAAHRCYRAKAASVSGQMRGHNPPARRRWVVLLGGQRFEALLRPAENEIEIEIEIDGHDYRLCQDWRIGEPLFRARFDQRELCVQIERRGPGYRLLYAGADLDALVLSERGAELHALMPAKKPPDLSRYLLSPMPGLLVKLLASAGERVEAGQELAVIEAMKMENVLRAEREVTIAEVLAEVGDSLAVDQAIMTFAQEPD